MDFGVWASFALAALLLAVIPGPGVASIVGFALSSGRRTALASVAGMAVGNAVAVSASLAGAGAVLAVSATAFTILKWVGAAYLIGIGLLAIRASFVPTDFEPRPAIGARAAFLANVAVGTFHPKTVLFFMAFATQFVDPSRSFLLQAAIMAATFTLIAAVTDTLYALAAARASSLISKPATRRWAGRCGGGVLIAAGVATAAKRR